MYSRYGTIMIIRIQTESVLIYKSVIIVQYMTRRSLGIHVKTLGLSVYKQTT